MPQGRPTGAAIRAREFRRSASLFWECEGFETDNLARQSAGMRRAATLPLGSTNVRRNDENEIEEACRLLSPHPEEPRSARRLEGWRRSPLWPTLRDARHWRAPQGEAQGQTPVWRNEPEVEFWRNEPETPKRLWAAGNCAEFSSPLARSALSRRTGSRLRRPSRPGISALVPAPAANGVSGSLSGRAHRSVATFSWVGLPPAPGT